MWLAATASQRQDQVRDFEVRSMLSLLRETASLDSTVAMHSYSPNQQMPHTFLSDEMLVVWITHNEAETEVIRELT